jgi:glycosyltransferase involved in cell wall biosynthesis/peptidoglycan/xylan/chitin deacetylase (PgdA/CDA1 family)
MMYPGRYYVKHVLPRRAQVFVRQRINRRRRKQVADHWPVHPASATPPPDWPGWPDGKQFALVITHDVDTARGLARCRELARLERGRGLNPAFYFVPEGRYLCPADLRAELAEGGAEIGLHGLYHDWRTFLSRRVFDRHLPRLQDYLKQWNAKGFRAPSTVRNLDWIGELDVLYDSSTFDTDPYEPQSHGAGTIFPYWVQSRTANRRYVELPYTLAQDFTLFVMLGERNADVWKRKLDWIAEQGGMALVIVHPDYLALDNKPGREEFAAEHYFDFLDYAQHVYGDISWQATPHQVAEHFARHCPRVAPRSRHRVCMMAYAFYDTDNRIIRYAETLAGRGDQVDVLALRRPGQAAVEWVRGVRVFRIQERTRNEGRKLAYLLRLLQFLVLSSWVLARKNVLARYHVVHVHSVPDFEVFAALLPKLSGSRVVLDIHDLVPEFYLSKLGATRHGMIYQMLLFLERISCRFADHVIVANHIWHGWLVKRSVDAKHCSVVLNYVVTPPGSNGHPRRIQQRPFRIVYPGGFQWHQGLDIAIRAFAIARDKMPGAEFHLYGEGSEKPALQRLVHELDLAGCVHLHETVPFHDVLDLLAGADLGVVPKRADSFGNEAYSTKILEYMSQGVPVLVSRTAIDTYYFDEQTVRFFRSGDIDDMSAAMVELARDPVRRARLIDRGYAYAAANNWEVKQHEYLGLIDRLASREEPVLPGEGHAVAT